MNVVQLIARKRDGEALSREEIEFLISGYAAEQIPDYQMAAFAMAVYFRGMEPAEVTALTRAMIHSGDCIEWPPGKTAVDKHSTGGIGDKTSIPLAPLLACCGVIVPMISGRGLGATGGTLDKLESIEGYRSELSIDEFRSVVNWNGCSIAGASARLAPADRRLYALRDVTATVPSIPLITASILSKKVVEGISALILDVKWGSGAFMKTLADARQLAQSLVRVGNELGVQTTALVTDMNQPLGRMIGNAVEIDESIDVLRGEGPEDVTCLTLELGSRLLVQAGVFENRSAAQTELQDKIQTGAALKRLEEMVSSQGGDLNRRRRVAKANSVVASQSGFISRVNAERLGLAVIELKGGRQQLGDPLDHSTGIEFLVRLGDQVEAGQTVARVFSQGPETDYAKELVEGAIGYSEAPVDPPQLIVEQF